MKNNELAKYTNEQLLTELERRKSQKLLLVWNKDKLANGIIKIPKQDLKELNIGEITSTKLSSDYLCLITEKDTLLAQLLKERNHYERKQSWLT